MTLRAVRIVKAKHAAAAFTGEGARLFGGRWNEPGAAMVYTSGSVSLAILEMLVHLEAQELMKRYVLFDVTFDEKLVTHVDMASLPKTWRKSPVSRSVQRLGTAWLAGGTSAILRVPSALAPSEWNYLINPAHRDFEKISVGPGPAVRFDARLIKSERN